MERLPREKTKSCIASTTLRHDEMNRLDAYVSERNKNPVMCRRVTRSSVVREAVLELLAERGF